jgi:hypothetical protein
VLRGALEVIHDHPVLRLDKKHPAAVDHRIGKAAIGVMLGIRQVEGLRGEPLTQPCSRSHLPAKWASRDCLAHTINHDTVVSGGATEEISPVRVRRVTVRPGIHEIRLPEDGALNAEKVSVSVPSAQRAPEGASIEDHLVGVRFPSAPHHNISSVREDA